MNKRIAAGVLAASLFGGAGVASVVGPPSAVFAADETPAATAPADIRKGPEQKTAEVLKSLVDKGTINQSQADAVAQALKDARPAGDRGPGGHGGGPGGPGGGGGPALMTKAAETLGMSETDLMSATRGGKSIAAVAKERNVDLQKVIDALVTQANSKLDEAVASGKLTQEQANQKKAGTAERITNMVNHVRGEGRGRDEVAPAPVPGSAEQPAA